MRSRIAGATWSHAFHPVLGKLIAVHRVLGFGVVPPAMNAGSPVHRDIVKHEHAGFERKSRSLGGAASISSTFWSPFITS